MNEEPRPDEELGEETGDQRAWRIFTATLFAIAALAFGAMGTCGVVSAVSSLLQPQTEMAPIGLVFGIPCALLGLIGAYSFFRDFLRRRRR